MNPWKVSAQFAAFVWYSNQKTHNKATAAEAAEFAKENWVAFLPYAHEGYGKLLIKISPNASEIEKKRALKTATAIKARLDGGAVFADVAGRHHEPERPPTVPEAAPLASPKG